MRIEIEHIPNTYNYGSLMMAINIINKLKISIKDVEIYVDAITEEDLRRIKIETNYENIFKIKIIESSKKNKLIRFIDKLNKEAQFYDMKIVLGGDDISEYYMKNGWGKRFLMMKMKANKVPTILLGQTIGPFTSYRKFFAKWALNGTKIYTRDDKCLNYLNNIGIKSAIKGRDLAFLGLDNSNSKKILEKYNLIGEKYITLVPSGLIKSYTSDVESYIKCWTTIIDGLVMKEQLKQYKIVLLMHVSELPQYGNSNDKIAIDKIMNSIKSNKVIPITDTMLASEAREILGNGLFTITGRMHAAVSTFYMRKPAISLSYSVKYSGVIGDGLDLNELVIEAADEELWKSDEISILVSEKVNYVLQNYDSLVKKIDAKVLETSRIVEEELDEVVNEIKKTNKKNDSNKYNDL